MPDSFPWLFFFFALLLVGIGFLLFYLRMMKIEAQYQQEKTAKSIREQLQGLIQALEKIDLRPLEGYLYEIKEKMGRLDRRLGRELGESRGNAEAASDPAASGSLNDLVVSRLARQGFEKVKILTELGSISTDPCEVKVEATKDGVSYKGRLLVHSGVVVESRMNPSYEVFP